MVRRLSFFLHFKVHSVSSSMQSRYWCSWTRNSKDSLGECSTRGPNQLWYAVFWCSRGLQFSTLSMYFSTYLSTAGVENNTTNLEYLGSHHQRRRTLLYRLFINLSTRWNQIPIIFSRNTLGMPAIFVSYLFVINWDLEFKIVPFNKSSIFQVASKLVGYLSMLIT